MSVSLACLALIVSLKVMFFTWTPEILDKEFQNSGFSDDTIAAVFTSALKQAMMKEMNENECCGTDLHEGEDVYTQLAGTKCAQTLEDEEIKLSEEVWSEYVDISAAAVVPEGGDREKAINELLDFPKKIRARAEDEYDCLVSIYSCS